MAGIFGFLGKAIGAAANIATGGLIGGAKASSSQAKELQTTLAEQNKLIAQMQAQATQAQGKTGFPWLPIVIGAAIAIPFFLFMRKRR